MKCLIIVDSVKDETLYSEYDIETLGVNIKAVINFIQMNIGEKPFFFQANKHRFVFQYNEHIWFILVSNDDDSEILLRHRLNLLNALFSMILGSTLSEKNTSKLNQIRKLKRKMSQISATVNTMFDESQSVLAQAYESLELNSGLRERCKKSLKDLLDTLPDSSYALLFVGTKLASHNVKTKEKHLLNHLDIFLLSIYIQIQLYPRVIEKVQMKSLDSPISQEISSFEEIPILDLDKNSNNSNKVDGSLDRQIANSHQDEMSPEEDNYETAPEDFEEPLYFLSSPFLDQLLEDSATTTTTSTSNNSTTNVNIPNNSSGNSSGNNKIPSPTSSTSSIPSSYSSSSLSMKRNKHHNILIESLKEGLKSTSTGDAVSLLNYSLYSIGYLDEYNQSTREIYTSITESAIKKFQEDNNIPMTGAADFSTIKLILCRVRASEPILKRRSIAYSDNDLGQFKDISLNDEQRSNSRNSNKDKDSSNSNNNNNNNINNSNSTGSNNSNSSSTTNTANVPPHPTQTPTKQLPRRNLNALNNTLQNFYSGNGGVETDENGNPIIGGLPINTAESTYEPINLRLGSSVTTVNAFCSEVSNNIFLIVINKGLNKTRDPVAEKKKLEESKQLIFNNISVPFGDFLLAKEKSNIAISRFYHIPGIVHFLLIDRANHRIRAPVISPDLIPFVKRDFQFNNQNNNNNNQSASSFDGSTNNNNNSNNDMMESSISETENGMVRFLKKKIWTMYSYCCQQLYRGNHYMIWNDKDFQYSYRLWIADDENNEHKLDHPVSIRPNPKSFYVDLLKSSFPHSSGKMKCYELLVLYIGVLPISMVSKNDKALYHLLFEMDE